MKKRVIAVGFFDGVHKGHKALTDKVLKIAKEKQCTSAVFSFKNHPEKVIFGKEIPLLYSNDERVSKIKEKSSVDEVFLWDFDEKNASMHWEQFVRDILIKEMNACHIVTGADFRFGHKGEGNSTMLSKICNELGIGYNAIDDVIINNERVSSTNIRSLIEKGHVKEANFLLGYPYSIYKEVEHGRKIGRTIGVRTINLSFPKEMQKPANGVYVSRVIIDNNHYKAVTNVGTVPTFLDDNNIIVEAHILDFNQDVYGKHAKIEFLDFLRYEQKFSGIEELKQTIMQNIEQTKEYFKENEL